MKIEVSIGEVIDKITILQIKKEKITDEKKLKHVIFELEVLEKTLEEEEIKVSEELITKLRDINQNLWDAEDVLREKERNKKYDEEFIKYAVLDATYNDQRFLVKNEINELYDSNIKEQKSYEGLYTAD